MQYLGYILCVIVGMVAMDYLHMRSDIETLREEVKNLRQSNEQAYRAMIKLQNNKLLELKEARRNGWNGFPFLFKVVNAVASKIKKWVPLLS
ncbi:hypothetical protein BOX15_Mlig020770g2 [Macrostomum lignano]|uniref:Uncharacterized protein n=1 Tax=Macrostomum lignano TaxID=282301 RepID=A0A267FUD3_9PLAT|nr:hypothetical protein BOX15_Mlig020770g2 [Macrostomum lignano]